MRAGNPVAYTPARESPTLQRAKTERGGGKRGEGEGEEEDGGTRIPPARCLPLLPLRPIRESCCCSASSWPPTSAPPIQAADLRSSDSSRCPPAWTFAPPIRPLLLRFQPSPARLDLRAPNSTSAPSIPAAVRLHLHGTTASDLQLLLRDLRVPDSTSARLHLRGLGLDLLLPLVSVTPTCCCSALLPASSTSAQR